MSTDEFQFAPGGVIRPGASDAWPPKPSLPPEPDCIVRLRHTLTRHDEFPGKSDPVAEAVIEAARDVLHTLDTERQRMRAMMRAEVVRRFGVGGLRPGDVSTINKPILDRMRDANNEQIREAARRGDYPNADFTPDPDWVKE